MNGTKFTNLGGTAGTTASGVIGANTTILNYSAAVFQNVSANILYYTLDGSTPVAGATNTLQLTSGQGVIFSASGLPYPQAGFNVLGSAASTNFALFLG